MILASETLGRYLFLKISARFLASPGIQLASSYHETVLLIALG